MPTLLKLMALMSCLSEDANSIFIFPTSIKTEKYSSHSNSTKKIRMKNMKSEELISILLTSLASSTTMVKTGLNKKYKSLNNMHFNLKFISKNLVSLYKKLLKVFKVKEAWNHLPDKEHHQSNKDLQFLKETSNIKKLNLQKYKGSNRKLNKFPNQLPKKVHNHKKHLFNINKNKSQVLTYHPFNRKINQLDQLLLTINYNSNKPKTKMANQRNQSK